MSKKCVLLVEDDIWLRDTFQTVLEQHNFNVVTTGNALEAIDTLDECRPDVIILDVFLPGPNGLLLLHEMRSHQDLGAIPAVIVTTSAEYFIEKDMTAYGVVRVLDKTTLQPSDIAAAARKAVA